MALEMKSACETCACDLPPESSDARICSYECTFCIDCVENRHGWRCPNCSGVLEVRPGRRSKPA